MLGFLVLVNFWTLFIVLLFQTGHSISETRFFSPPQVNIHGSAYSPWVIQTDLLSNTRPAHVCTYIACLYIKKICLLALPLLRAFQCTTSCCGTAQSVYCTTGIFGFLFHQEQCSCSLPQRWGLLRRLSSGYRRSPTWRWPLFCINCRS
jgi:hypothetical protein